MDAKQYQDNFDFLKVFVKTESEEIGSDQTKQNEFSPRKPQIFKKEYGDVLHNTLNMQCFDSKSAKQFPYVDEIKKEMVECELIKIEGRSDLLTKIESDMVYENVQMFNINIKQELENIIDVKGIDVSDIKQEVSECILPKIESDCELLTSHCDLPTLKIESNDCYSNYLRGTNSNKLIKNTAKVILKKHRRYACPICQNNFPSARSRSTHIGRHFKKRHEVCHFCGKFMKKSEFFHHFFIHTLAYRTKNHSNDKLLKFNLSSKKLKRKNIDDKSFKCGTCFKIFNQYFKLQKHLKIHIDEKPFKCDICSKVFTFKSSLQRHLILHSDEKPFKCDICSRGFNHKCNLQTHLLIHSDKKPFKCDICSKEFTRKSHLQQHLIIHSDVKHYKCDICSKRFKEKSKLQRHLLVHNDKKSFKCNICSKGFVRNSRLQEHLIIHSVEKPFKCDICSKDFNYKSNFQKHLIIHSLNEKPYKCDICSKGFNHKCSLQNHLFIHSGEKPFKCEICPKEFTRKCYLQQHLIIHSGEKQFSCDICSKRFREKSKLQRHLIIHSDKKPFKCDSCSKEFNQKFHLQKHLNSEKCKRYQVPSHK